MQMRLVGRGLMLLLAGLLMGTVVLANKPVELTQGQAVEMALKQNLGFLIARLDYEYARLTYDRARADLLVSYSIIREKSAEAAWDSAQRKWEQARKDLKLNILSSYFAAWAADQGVETAEFTLEQAKETLRLTELRFKEGLAGKSDMLNAEWGVITAVSGLVTAWQSRDLAYQRLAADLGLDINTPLILAEPEGVTIEPLKISLEKATELALANSATLASLRSSLEIAQKQVESDKEAGAPQLTQEMSINRARKAELDLLQAEVSVKIQVRTLYDAVIWAENTIVVNGKSVELAEESYWVAQLRYCWGVELESNVKKAALDFERAKQSYWQSQLDYEVARFKLLDFIFIGAR